MQRPMMPGPVPFSSSPVKPRSSKPLKIAPQHASKSHARRAGLPKLRDLIESQAANRKSSKRQSTAYFDRAPRRARSIETLETRQVFAAPTLAPLTDVALSSGAPLQIALDGNDTDGDQLSFSAISSNPNIVAELRSNSNRILRLEISYAGDGGANPAFTGVLEFVLFEDLAAPVTGRIIELVQSGFYDGLIFHRVINNFVIQGGDPLGNGTGGSGTDFDDFFNADLQHTGTGLLSMAKSADDTNDSQFFITEGPTRNLDFHHSIFGQLVEGENIRELISNLPVGAGDKPTVDVVITKATIVQNKDDQVLTVKAADGYTGSGTVTVEVSDGNGGTTTRTFTVNATPDTVDNTPFFVNLPTTINATANTPTTVQLQSLDVDSGSRFYGAVLWDSADADKLTVSIDETTGLLTLTPLNGFTGVVSVFVGVTQTNFGSDQVYDSQQIPVFIAPAAPTGVDLLNASDTGSSATDNITKLNNSNAANQLTFRVSGVVSGQTVQLFDGNTLIGQAVANGTTVDITTNGSVTLSDGLHNIVAKQGKPGTAYTVGNQSGTTDLLSGASTALAVTIDSTLPVFTSSPIILFAGGTYVYDAQTDQEGAGVGYSLITSPTGMTINATTGVVTWTPTPAQIASGTAAVSILAVDAAGNATNQTYTIFFTPNEAPVLAPVADRTTDEHVTLNIAMSATDPNLPGDQLTYSLIGNPANATINAATGAFSFTPDDTQGNGTFSFTVRVTDAGGLFSEQSFSVAVNDTNSPPFVVPIGVVPAIEFQEVVVGLPVGDVDEPSDTLTFQILSAPAGSTIDALGVFRWTPGELDGGTIRDVSVLVDDGNGGTLTVNFKINVQELNSLPTLNVGTNFSVDEHTQLSFQATATDADLPTQSLSFSLIGAPTGATINAATGVFVWTPNEAQGPGVFTFQVRVQDSLGGTATQNVTVSVTEVNQAPTLGQIADQFAFQGGKFSVQAIGADGDLPTQTLTYSLLSAPAGFSIDSATGAISWAVPTSGATGAYEIRFAVADSFGLTAIGTFALTISEFNFSSFGFANTFIRSLSAPPTPVVEADVVRADELALSSSTTLATTFIPPDTAEAGLNRIQAVNGEEILQNVQKPAIQDDQVQPAKNQTESPEIDLPKPTERATPSANPFENTNTSSNAPLSETSRIDAAHLRRLRGLVLADEAVDGPSLPWSGAAYEKTFELAFRAQTPRDSVAEPMPRSIEKSDVESPVTETIATETPATNSLTSTLAAATVAAVLSPMIAGERRMQPAALPLVDARVSRQRGLRRLWF